MPRVTNSPIGVFDSGLGGLSVLRAIRTLLPDEDLIYVADSGNAPYGDRESAFIEERSVAITEFLVQSGVKAVVVACNTATVVAVHQLRERFALPIVALEPAIKPAVALTRSGVVGVLATPRTLASPSVARLCDRHGQGARIILQPCPGLVEQVECGDIDSAQTDALLRCFIDPLLAAGADTLVLGCTHYPFLQPAIRRIVGPGVAILESSDAVARELHRRLGDLQQLRSAANAATLTFFSTGPLDTAARLMSSLWGSRVDVRSLP